MCTRAELPGRLHVFCVFGCQWCCSGWAFTYQRIWHSLYLLKLSEALEVGERALSTLFAGKVCNHLGLSSVSSAATVALAPFRQAHVSLPTSGVNAPSLAHICGDVAFSHLDGLAQRLLTSEQDHLKRVTREGSANIHYDRILGHNELACSDCVGSLVKSGALTFLPDSKCPSGILYVCKKNLSLRLILDARRSNQHFRVPPKFTMATGDVCRVSNFMWRIRMRVKAPALHIASCDV